MGQNHYIYPSSGLRGHFLCVTALDNRREALNSVCNFEPAIKKLKVRKANSDKSSSWTREVQLTFQLGCQQVVSVACFNIRPRQISACVSNNNVRKVAVLFKTDLFSDKISSNHLKEVP